MGLQGGKGKAQLEQPVPVRGEEAATRGKGGDAFHERADELGAGVKVQRDRMFERRSEHLVFDHQGRHANQGHRVPMEAALVAADVEHADHIATVVRDRGCRAGEKMVRGEEVLVRVDRTGASFGDRGSDRIGSFALFGPRDTRC